MKKRTVLLVTLMVAVFLFGGYCGMNIKKLEISTILGIFSVMNLLWIAIIAIINASYIIGKCYDFIDFVIEGIEKMRKGRI